VRFSCWRGFAIRAPSIPEREPIRHGLQIRASKKNPRQQIQQKPANSARASEIFRISKISLP